MMVARKFRWKSDYGVSSICSHEALVCLTQYAAAWVRRPAFLGLSNLWRCNSATSHNEAFRSVSENIEQGRGLTMTKQMCEFRGTSGFEGCLHRVTQSELLNTRHKPYILSSYKRLRIVLPWMTNVLPTKWKFATNRTEIWNKLKLL